MPTTPNLGEFVERDGKLYFIKADNLAAALDKPQAIGVVGRSGKRSDVELAYQLGYGICMAVLIPVLFLVVLFPIPLFALLIGMGVLKFIQGGLR